MKCMSCITPTTGAELKRFHHLFLCSGCASLASKAEQEINATIDRAREMANNWLEDHIVKGGLLVGGDGHGIRAATAGGVLLPSAQVPVVWGAEAADGAGPRDPSR
jgi:hypothetical protein